MTFGTESELLALLCQPAELQRPVAIPANVRFWGLDSGKTGCMHRYQTPITFALWLDPRPQRDPLQGRGTAWEAKTMGQCALRLSWACACSATPRHAKQSPLTGDNQMLRRTTISGRAI